MEPSEARTAPFLSICIPTYNRAQSLARTLASIVPQVRGERDVEIVISDNASSDETGEVGRRYEREHPFIRYTRNETNVGFDGNIVACIKKAAGEYVSFFSDDDLSQPGTFPSLLKQLREVRPSIAYIYHTPFLHNNPAHLMRPALETRRVMEDGTEYILDYGLGFLSSLTVRTAEARRFLDKVVRGRGTAHLDVALRVALTGPGPFLMDGTLAVLSKYDYECGYDILRYGPLNVTAVHEELWREGLLSAEALAEQKRRQVPGLPWCVVNNRLGGHEIVRAGELRRVFGGIPSFYVLVYPLALVPVFLMRALGRPARQVLRWYRRLRFRGA